MDTRVCPHCFKKDLDARASRCHHCGGSIYKKTPFLVIGWLSAVLFLIFFVSFIANDSIPLLTIAAVFAFSAMISFNVVNKSS